MPLTGALRLMGVRVVYTVNNKTGELMAVSNSEVLPADWQAIRPSQFLPEVVLPERVYLSLGSNVGDRAANLRAAMERLAEAGTVKARSGLYETEPVDFRDQPWFLNCVVALETGKTPRDLLAHALAIEEAMGRRRTRDKGPRAIDIDILLFGDRVINEPGLKIPHPAMHARRFVLEPLAEIAPGVLHPSIQKTARQLLAGLPTGQVVRNLRPET